MADSSQAGSSSSPISRVEGKLLHAAIGEQSQMLALLHTMLARLETTVQILKQDLEAVIRHLGVSSLPVAVEPSHGQDEVP